MTAKDVFEKLIQKAYYRRYLKASGDDRIVEQCVREGKPIPKDCLPASLLNSLTTEEREVLQSFTSDDAKSYRFP